MARSSQLFEGLAESHGPERGSRGGAPRLRHPERQQIGWQQASLDELVSPDHPVRAIWGLVSALDLGELHDRVKAREGVPGQAPPVCTGKVSRLRSSTRVSTTPMPTSAVPAPRLPSMPPSRLTLPPPILPGSVPMRQK